MSRARKAQEVRESSLGAKKKKKEKGNAPYSFLKTSCACCVRLKLILNYLNFLIIPWFTASLQVAFSVK